MDIQILTLMQREAQTAAILRMNDVTQRYGMTVTQSEAQRIAAAARETLRETERIDAYLRRIEIEQRMLARLDEADVTRALEGYDRAYREGFDNLCEIVFCLQGKERDDSLSEEERAYLRQIKDEA